MASISLDPGTGFYRIQFRFGGRQFQRSLKTGDESKAEWCSEAAGISELLEGEQCSRTRSAAKSCQNAVQGWNELAGPAADHGPIDIHILSPVPERLLNGFSQT